MITIPHSFRNMAVLSAVASLSLSGARAALINVATVTASTHYNDLDPIRTINSSGINGPMTSEGELGTAVHDNNGSAVTMWHSAVNAPIASQWLKWDFAAPSNLRTIYYWNHNQANLIDRGIQNVNIKVSTDNGANFTSVGDFTLIQASGLPGEHCHVLELPATLTGVTNIRFDIASNYGGIVVGLSEIRFSTIPSVQPDPQGTFTSSEGIILNQDRLSGQRVPATLNWDTTNATALTIAPGIGSVAASDSTSVTPPLNADTTYTLTGQGAAKNLTLATTVRTVAGGSSSWRYVRFTPTKLRDNATANSIQLAELGFLAGDGSFLYPVSVTNPGGNNPDGQQPQYVTDGSGSTKWLDFNKGPLVFDFGAAAAPFVDYQFVTAEDAPERDPVRWILEGSSDQASWTLIDNVTAFDYPMPATRSFASAPIPLPGASLQPLISFKSSTTIVQAGDPVTLSWTTQAAANVSIDQGVGNVTSSGSRQVTPTADTTYTLTATSAGGKVVTSAISVHVEDFAVKTIAYENFNAAGDELSLLGVASVLADARATADPTAAKRLRLNGDTASVVGGTWFRRRQNVGAGFESNFSLNMINFTPDQFGGADGIVFSIQNSPDGVSALPAQFPERGIPANALNITFDSYKNDDEESSATVQVRAGSNLLRRVDLAALSGITLSKVGDLTQTDPAAAPYQVRVTYVPGDLDVYFNGVLAIDSLPVNLGDIGAIDGQGTAFAGFLARTGGAYESHDVTRWSLVSGPPVSAPSPLKLTASSINAATGALSMTWNSTTGKTYRITASSDLLTWGTSLKTGIAATVGGSTNATTTFTPGSVRFFRVEEE